MGVEKSKAAVTSVVLLILAACSLGSGASAASGCLYFDGDDHVLLGRDTRLNPERQYTIEVWVKRESGTWRGIFTRYNHRVVASYNLGVESKYVFSGESPFRYTHSKQVARTDEWVHLAAVYDNGRIALYRNSVLQESSSGAGNNRTPTVKTLIGATLERGEVCCGWKGWIDEVRFWGTTRSPEEIEGLMNEPLTGDEAGLIGYWDFNEGSGQVAHDKSPNQLHGTLGATTEIGDDDPEWVLGDAPVTPPLDINAAVRLSPAKPTCNDDIRCVLDIDNRGGYENLEFDYHWFVDGEPVDDEEGAETSAVLPSSRIRKGNRCSCSVTITDGDSSLATTTTSVIIRNATPSAPVFRIRPANPESWEDMTIEIEEESFDADGDPVRYAVRWLASPDAESPLAEKKAYSGSLPEFGRIPSTAIVSGEVYRAVVTPYEDELGTEGERTEGVAAWDQVYVGRNRRPWVRIFEPGREDVHTREQTKLTWQAGDYDNEAVTVSLYYDNDHRKGGETLIAERLPATGSLHWTPPSACRDMRYTIFARAFDTNRALGESFSEGAIIVPADCGGISSRSVNTRGY